MGADVGGGKESIITAIKTRSIEGAVSKEDDWALSGIVSGVQRPEHPKEMQKKEKKTKKVTWNISNLYKTPPLVEPSSKLRRGG